MNQLYLLIYESAYAKERAIITVTRGPRNFQRRVRAVPASRSRGNAATARRRNGNPRVYELRDTREYLSPLSRRDFPYRSSVTTAFSTLAFRRPPRVELSSAPTRLNGDDITGQHDSYLQ